MYSYPAKLLVIHPTPGEDPEKELNVQGLVEWDDATFTVKRANGEVLFQVDIKLLYKHIETSDLYQADPQISLTSPTVDLEIEIVRKQRHSVIVALRQFIEEAAATDPEFGRELRAKANQLLNRGIGCLAISVGGLLLGAGYVLLVSRKLHDWLGFVLFWFALGLLVGPSLIYAALKQRRLVRRRDN